MTTGLEILIKSVTLIVILGLGLFALIVGKSKESLYVGIFLMVMFVSLLITVIFENKKVVKESRGEGK